MSVYRYYQQAIEYSQVSVYRYYQQAIEYSQVSVYRYYQQAIEYSQVLGDDTMTSSLQRQLQGSDVTAESDREPTNGNVESSIKHDMR